MSPLSQSKVLVGAYKCLAKINTGFMQSRSLMSKHLEYTRFGDPIEVVKFRESSIRPLQSQEVLVRMLAAPVNPADINTIQGKYPVKVEFPCIPGNEGVGIVEEVTQDTNDIKKGDKVIVIKGLQGTWRNYGVFNNNCLKVVPPELDNAAAASLTVNPCTAYRMLTDFVPVKNGNLVVIQNGANSACGQNVIQLCNAWGIPNVNIVRDRPGVDRLKCFLKSLGATYVLTESELRSTDIFKKNCIDQPTLALNCVGGKSSLELSRKLKHCGVMVTYGGMSREPVTIPTSSLIFKNTSFYGFWMTRWVENADWGTRDSMLNELIELMCQGKLTAPLHKSIKFNNYKEVLINALKPEGYVGHKYMLDFTP